MLYNLLPVILGIIIALLGAFMALFPKLATRQDRRDDPRALTQNRVSGLIMLVLGLLLSIFKIILLLR